MAWLTIIENALGFLFTTKDVAIFNGTSEVLKGNMLFNAVIMEARVKENSDMPEHPIESGVKIVDHKIILPVEIDIRFVMPAYLYASVYKELKEIYEQSIPLRIKTKMSYYNNMVLQNMPHNENADTVDRVVFNLHFKQVMTVEPKYIALPPRKVSKVDYSSTQKLGTNVTNAGSSANKSILKKGVDSIKGLFK